MRQSYSTLLIDLDHTLLDSDASEALAFDNALRRIGIDTPLQHLALYRDINHSLWAAVERGETSAAQVRVTRFEQLFSSMRHHGNASAAADLFSDGLANFGELYPGTHAVLEQLSRRCTMAIISNGISTTQRARVARLGLARYFKAVVISSEVGLAKPAAGIFTMTLEQLGDPPVSNVLMVGDSLTSDMQGGRSAGIATCWYNPSGRLADRPCLVDVEITELSQLISMCAA